MYEKAKENGRSFKHGCERQVDDMTDIGETQGKMTLQKVAGVIVHAKVNVSELSNCGWLPNFFFDHDVPFLRRSNLRCDKRRFWNAFLCALSACGFFSRPTVFHENFGGWAGAMRGRSRFVECESLPEAVSFLRDYSYYNRRAWQSGNRSDNYEILDRVNNILAVFTHHGEVYFFGPRLADLTVIRRSLRKVGLWSVIEGGTERT